MQTYTLRSDGEEKEGRCRTTPLVAKSKKILGFVHDFFPLSAEEQEASIWKMRGRNSQSMRGWN